MPSVLRVVGVGLAVAVVVGLATGLAARAARRLVALAAGGPATFSVGPTAGIVLPFCLVAVPVLAVRLADRWRERPAVPARVA